MKKYIFIVLISSILWSCTTEPKIRIKGSYPDGKKEMLYLELLNIAQIQEIDSIKVSKNGTFKFKYDLKSPELILVKNHAGQYINILAFPGDNIELNIPSESYTSGYSVNGSEESNKIKLLVENVENTKVKLDSIIAAINALENRNGPESKVLVDAYMQAFQKQKKNNIRFIIENLNSLSSIYALYQRVAPDVYLMNDIKDLQYFKIVADSVRVKYPESTLVNSLTRDVDLRIAQYNNILRLNQLTANNVSETGYINLEIKDQFGDERSISELKGKVILVNFWASWDDNSKQANRSLINTYKKYHDKGFEIYSIAMESDKTTWRSTIDFEEYPWINVSELTYPSSYAATAYNVKSLPASYLIDREGNIVARDLIGNKLSTWLDNLL